MNIGDGFPSSVYMQVYKDYRILTRLSDLGIAPIPLFRSSGAEEKIVGTSFIVMTMIEVSSIAEA